LAKPGLSKQTSATVEALGASARLLRLARWWILSRRAGAVETLGASARLLRLAHSPALRRCSVSLTSSLLGREQRNYLKRSVASRGSAPPLHNRSAAPRMSPCLAG
jgi:hypothetical protein